MESTTIGKRRNGVSLFLVTESTRGVISRIDPDGRSRFRFHFEQPIPDGSQAQAPRRTGTMIHADRFHSRRSELECSCHRCGWTGPVVKVRHRDRKLLGTGRAYRRLCTDCIESLYRSRTTGQRSGTEVRPQLRALRDRDVA